MKLVVDACVLFPTLMREIVLGAAEAGVFEPVWSARILEEWRRAVARDGGDAGVEIALLRERFAQAEVTGEAEGLWLPDPDDIHVLATAIAAGADGILTLNLKDFPTRVLAGHGLIRRDPDGVLVEAFAEDSQQAGGVVQAVLDRAQAVGADAAPRALLKRARLPRLGKAMFG